jgi:hypothetical protein
LEDDLKVQQQNLTHWMTEEELKMKQVGDQMEVGRKMSSVVEFYLALARKNL